MSHSNGSGSVSKLRPYIILTSGRCGHGPLQKNVRFQRRGRCPHRSVGAIPERSEKTDTPIPLASWPMRASAPTKNNVRFQRRGRCPHRPAGAVPERPERTNVPLPTSFRSNESIGLLRNKRILNVGGDAHIAPRVRHQSGPKKRTCPFRRHSGRMKAPVSKICIWNFPLLLSIQSHIFHFPSLRIGETVVK